MCNLFSTFYYLAFSHVYSVSTCSFVVLISLLLFYFLGDMLLNKMIEMGRFDTIYFKCKAIFRISNLGY